MHEFVRFYDEANKGDWYLEIYHSSIMDWCIRIGYKTTHHRRGEAIINVQDCDMDLAFAKAQVAFKEWLRESEGGY
ncbi:hypothetical protein [Brevibacillus sp. DP1.3A]|uniref:hypothetical protein n=1 Tax=Brevibacillus sp. DP1.3A TaxID=2738867 RepID=UPI00156A75F4|nr:hypothetical protein [Brevibacillus sp. DP1.3A]UED78102.1 hypothetical protein HP399_030725 [Brevibacillus sp. DP1.3A]